jgi:hypothetical protein
MAERGRIVPRWLAAFEAQQAARRAKRSRLREGDHSYHETEQLRRDNLARYIDDGDREMRFREIGRRLGR